MMRGGGKNAQPIWPPLLWLAISLVVLCLQGINADIYSDYEKCRDDQGFGSKSLVCDVNNSLSEPTVHKLEGLLKELQRKIACECPQGCDQPYTGLLHVTTIDGIAEAEVPLNESAKKIFEDAKLSNQECDNGLLIIYNRNTQQLATYRGDNRFAKLDADKLQKLASKSSKEGDALALEYLLSNYKPGEGEPLLSEVHRADAWPSILGLVVALVLALVIVAVLLSFCLAKICPFCRRGSSKKDKYYVNPVTPPRTLKEPIFVALPPSTPYSGPGTPIHHPSTFTPSTLPPPIPIRSRTSSRPITPMSTQRTRIHPIYEGSLKGSIKTPERTPQFSKQKDIDRAEPGTLPRSSKAPSVSTFDQPTTPPPVPKHQHHQPSPRMRGTASPDSPDPLVLSSTDLPFLDPLRRQEVQTREDYIY